MNAFNVIVKSCRLLVGSLFIVSGLIKANDALGRSLKQLPGYDPKEFYLQDLEDVY
jgi:hypothetical protein